MATPKKAPRGRDKRSKDPNRPPLDERFEAFHAANPTVFALFTRFACELKEAGATRGSAKMIFERIRYEHVLKTITSDEFKLNNDYTSRYARMLVETLPEFEGWFVTRETKAEAIAAMPTRDERMAQMGQLKLGLVS